MLDENPKSRIDLPSAASVTAASARELSLSAQEKEQLRTQASGGEAAAATHQASPKVKPAQALNGGKGALARSGSRGVPKHVCCCTTQSSRHSKRGSVADNLGPRLVAHGRRRKLPYAD